jgi:DNA replication protein DnaC
MSENPTDPKTRLIDNLKELHLPAMRGGFEEVARIAQQESQSYERYLLELTERECQARRGNRIERSLRDSRLPLEKTLESLELKRLPVKVVQQVRALLDGTFADRRENVLAFGNPGSGKTHVLSAISHELIRSGRRVYFRNCGLMVQDLLAAKRDLRISTTGRAGGMRKAP